MEYKFSNILDFANFILGCYARVKELHWRTQSKAIHESLDNMTWSLSNILDRIMEQSLSIYGREVLNSGDVQATVIVCDNFEDLINLVNTTTVEFKNSLDGVSEFKAMSSELDNFIFETNIDKYRGELV